MNDNCVKPIVLIKNCDITFSFGQIKLQGIVASENHPRHKKGEEITIGKIWSLDKQLHTIETAHTIWKIVDEKASVFLDYVEERLKKITIEEEQIKILYES